MLKVEIFLKCFILYNLVFAIKKTINLIFSKQIVLMTKKILNRCTFLFIKYEYN